MRFEYDNMPLTEARIREIIRQELASQQRDAQYGVSRVPVHTHNGLDSPAISAHDVTGFQTLPGTGQGVVSTSLLNGQNYLGPPTTTTLNPSRVVQYPLLVIYGSGTTSSDNLTATPSAGATSATLTGAWGGSTGLRGVQFGSDEVRNVQFSNGSTSITWSPPLEIGAVSSTISIIANARFKGGDAPDGTMVLFRNDDDGVLQFWVRSQGGVIPDAWAGVELGGAGLFIYG